MYRTETTAQRVMAVPKRKCEEILQCNKHRKCNILTLLDLPVELILIIISHLDCDSTTALLASSKYLHKTFVENECMFNLVLQLNHPYEYFNYQLLHYYCNAIQRPLKHNFKQVISTFKHYSKTWHYIVPVCYKGKCKVKLKLAPVTSERTRIFLQNCVNMLLDLRSNSYNHIFDCLNKCENTMDLSSCSPSVRDTVRSEVTHKLKKCPEGYATVHLIQVIIVLLDLIHKI